MKNKKQLVSLKKVLSAFLIISLLLFGSCAPKTEKTASYYKNESLTEAEKFVNENKLFPDEYIGCFNENSPLERREFATVLYKLAGEPEVKDDLKLIQTDKNAFYYDACMFTACNDMTYDLKLKPEPEPQKKPMTPKDWENLKPTESVYIDDMKVPYFEVIYGLYNYAKYAGLNSNIKADFDLTAQGGTREISLRNTPCFKKAISGLPLNMNIAQVMIEDINDYYAWAVNYDIIEANGDGHYEIENEITHGEFAKIMQRFYTNVLNA